MPRLRASLIRRVKQRTRARLTNTLNKHARDFDVLYVFWAQHERFVKSPLPTIATIQDVTAIEFPEILGADETQEVTNETRRWLEQSICVVSSESMRQRLERLFPETKNICIVRHAISPHPDAKKAEPEPPKNIPWSSFLIYPANLNVHKNHSNLLIGFSRWPNRSSFPLVLVGEGTDLLRDDVTDNGGNQQITRLRGLIRRLGLKEGKDFFALGYVSDAMLSVLISRARALIMPSLAEGGGSFPVEEALTAGVPVVCSDIPVMREHVGGRDAAVTWFDPDSPSSIVAGLEYLFGNYQSLKTATEHAMTVPRPSWDDVANDYVAIFERAAQGKPA